MYTYSDYITNTDLIPRGYNLYQEGILDDIHFQNKEDAVNDFMQGCCDIIYNLIKNYRGIKWTDNFFEDMKQSDLTGKALKCQNALKKALVEQCIFTYDCGDPQARSFKGVEPYAPKAVEALWNLVIFN